MSSPILIVSVIILFHGKVLLIKREKDPGKGKWAFVAGHVEKDELLSEAVIRETREEVGLEIEKIKKMKAYDFPKDGKRYKVCVFLAESKKNAIKLQKEEVSAGRWVKKENCKNLKNLGPITQKIIADLKW